MKDFTILYENSAGNELFNSSYCANDIQDAVFEAKRTIGAVQSTILYSLHKVVIYDSSSEEGEYDEGRVILHYPEDFK